MAMDSGLRAIAITDHDSVEGVAPALIAARDCPSLIVIPGVEISTDVPHGEVHILGYFIDHTDPGLAEILKRLRDSRRVRAQRMVAKLANLGIHVSWERVQELAGGGSIGRPHIAQAMFEHGSVPSFKEAFLKYIGRNGPAYVEREKMTPSQAVELLVKTGGLPVLAHPAGIDDLEEFIPELQNAGLVGIEAYYNNYIQGAGAMGKKFKNYYKGHIKMGDTPSLAYVMNGDPEDPFSESWGGNFAQIGHSSRYLFERNTSTADTLVAYGVVEWRFKGPKTDIPEDSACFTLEISNQIWPGYSVKRLVGRGYGCPFDS